MVFSGQPRFLDVSIVKGVTVDANKNKKFVMAHTITSFFKAHLPGYMRCFYKDRLKKAVKRAPHVGNLVNGLGYT